MSRSYAIVLLVCLCVSVCHGFPTDLQSYVFAMNYRIVQPDSGQQPKACYETLSQPVNNASSTKTTPSDTGVPTTTPDTTTTTTTTITTTTRKGIGNAADVRVEYTTNCAVVSMMKKGSSRKMQHLLITDLNNGCSITHMENHFWDLSRDHYFCTARDAVVTQGGSYMVQATDDYGLVDTTHLFYLPQRTTVNPVSIKHWDPYIILQKVLTTEPGSVAVSFEQPPDAWSKASNTRVYVELHHNNEERYAQYKTVENNRNDDGPITVTFTQVHQGSQYWVTLIAKSRPTSLSVEARESVRFDCIGAEWCDEISAANDHYCREVNLEPLQCSASMPSSLAYNSGDANTTSSNYNHILIPIIATASVILVAGIILSLLLHASRLKHKPVQSSPVSNWRPPVFNPELSDNFVYAGLEQINAGRQL